MGEQGVFLDPFFLSAVNNSDDCICVLDLDGRVTFANLKGRQAVTLRNSEEQYGAVWAELWPAEVAGKAAAAVASAVANGERVDFRAFHTTPTDSRLTCWKCTVTPVRDPQSQEVVGIVTTSRNVTLEVNQAALLNAVVDNVPAAISVKNARNGRFGVVNKALEEVVGYSADEMIGRTDHDLFPKEQADFFRAKDQELLDSKTDLLIEQEPITGADGRERILRTKKVVIREEGQPRYILCLSEDITDELEAGETLRRALDASEQANRAKSEFLANMSHEIRTPLNGVMGVAGALAKTELSDRQAEMVSIIETSAKTLETLLSDILDLARIEAGKVEFRPEPFDLAGSVNACAALFEASAEAKGLELQVDISPRALGGYVGDAPRIRQIVSNLLSNAVKFTSKGSVRLRVSAERGETSSRLWLEVRDTGIGFDAETKARLFSRFEQADGSITRRFGGTGLGLSISRALAEAMGGSLHADATPGEGACFTLMLDLPRCAGEFDLWMETAPEPTPEQQIRDLRVLVAEDHPTNRRVVELILGAAGVDLTCVENGAEALAAVETQPFDLVLMDMQMPVMDGLTAIRAIRAREAAEGAGRIPIYVLTANAMPEHITASEVAGADGHLSKPILAENLLNLVAEVAAGLAEAGSGAEIAA
jgi:PAS domain S-box-containing protein